MWKGSTKTMPGLEEVHGAHYLYSFHSLCMVEYIHIIYERLYSLIVTVLCKTILFIVIAGGTRTETCAGEWPVSYHGTLNTNAESIAKNGYDITKRKREKYGQGIYSSPCIKVAEDYAKKFSKNNKKYKVVFQNRVSPSKLKIHSTSHGEYWLQPDDRLIRPYGLCIKELDNRQ